MTEIIRADLPFERKEVTSQEALDFFKAAGEEYKVELIRTWGERVSLYARGILRIFVVAPISRVRAESGPFI